MHPELLDGVLYAGNAERQPFLAEVTDTADDLSKVYPVRASVPIVAVRVGQYKVRAIIDTGSTSTLVSTALLAKLGAWQAKMKPTSQTYHGVDEQPRQYAGVIPDFPMQLT